MSFIDFPWFIGRLNMSRRQDSVWVFTNNLPSYTREVTYNVRGWVAIPGTDKQLLTTKIIGFLDVSGSLY